jgi:hypothetical protein
MVLVKGLGKNHSFLCSSFNVFCFVENVLFNYLSKLVLWLFENNRVIRKVRKTQHQNPEFGLTQGEIKKKLQKNTLAFKGGMKLRKPSILVVN